HAQASPSRRGDPRFNNPGGASMLITKTWAIPAFAAAIAVIPLTTGCMAESTSDTGTGEPVGTVEQRLTSTSWGTFHYDWRGSTPLSTSMTGGFTPTNDEWTCFLTGVYGGLTGSITSNPVTWASAGVTPEGPGKGWNITIDVGLGSGLAVDGVCVQRAA